MVGFDFIRKRKDIVTYVIFYLYKYLLSIYCKLGNVFYVGDTIDNKRGSICF